MLNPMISMPIAAAVLVFTVAILFEKNAMRTVFHAWAIGTLLSAHLLLSGSEFLSIFQFCLVSIHAVLSVSHSVGFGLKRTWDEPSVRDRVINWFVALSLVGILGWVASRVAMQTQSEIEKVSLASIGREMFNPLFVSTVVLMVIGVAFLIGLGVISRTEREYE